MRVTDDTIALLVAKVTNVTNGQGHVPVSIPAKCIHILCGEILAQRRELAVLRTAVEPSRS